MDKKDGFLRRAGDFLAGKGFYIVLILCVAVIGASGWAMMSLRNNGDSENKIDGTGTEEPPTIADSRDYADSQDEPVMAEEDISANAQTDTIAEQPDDSAQTQADLAEPTYVWPVSGEVVVFHSLDELIYDETMSDWRTHSGIDISADVGIKVVSMSSGTVESIVNDALYGTTVTIDHGNDLKSVYSNMSASPAVSEGQTVAAGETIGSVGQTAIAESSIASHLHLEVIATGMKVDPLDYLP